MTLFSLCSRLIGEDPKYTAHFHPSSKRKIVLYANAMMIPVLMWFANGYLLSREVLQAPLWAALVTAVFASLTIFIIERSIIMSNGSKVIMCFRLLLGFLIAFLGSLCLDEVIFKNDIDLKIAEYKSATIDKSSTASASGYEKQIKEMEGLVLDKRNDWVEAQKHASEECDGTGGSRIARRGPICEMKIENARQLQADYNREAEKLTVLKVQRDSVLALAKTEALHSFNEKGLLLRIRALFDLVWNDPIMIIAYTCFTMLIFLLEFLVVLIKMFSHDTIDDKLEKARDKALEEKMNALISRRSEYRSSAEILERIQTTNHHLKQNHARLLS